MIATLLAVAWGAPLQAVDIAAALTSFNAAAHAPVPLPDDGQLQALAGGEVVTMLSHEVGVDRWRAVGFVVSELPRERLWVASQDPDAALEPRLREARLSQQEEGRYIWYGLLDLPVPFSDRHWALEVWNNVALARESGGQSWEHPWALRPELLPLAREQIAAGTVAGLAAADFDAAWPIPANDGGWLTIGLPDGRTLLGHHSDTQLGGVFPDRLVGHFIVEGMEAMLREVLVRAAALDGHYVPGHPVIFGGDGQPVPFLD
ncbi:MAG: hypothetical protein ACI8S6_004384 [Myxococcota bacterium]|jgi:hypothetical protein